MKMSERIEIFELIERLDAASRDETLSDGMLYRAAAERLAEYISRDVKYWHSIMQRTDKQADRIAELKAENKRLRQVWTDAEGRESRIEKLQAKLDRVRTGCDIYEEVNGRSLGIRYIREQLGDEDDNS
jgi:hypothetical protein